jgi:hypothetical protein
MTPWRVAQPWRTAGCTAGRSAPTHGGVTHRRERE